MYKGKGKEKFKRYRLQSGVIFIIIYFLDLNNFNIFIL